MPSVLYYPLIFAADSDLHDNLHNTTSGTSEWTSTVNNAAHEDVSFPVS